MTAAAFLLETNQYFNIPFHWMAKMVTGLRKVDPEFYPDTRFKGKAAHVTSRQAAHLLRLFALNLNPSADDFQKKVNEYKQLKSESSDFISDLSDLLNDDGAKLYGPDDAEMTTGNLTEYVNRVSFSLDRPFVTIVRRIQGINEEGRFSRAYAEKEVVYGVDPNPLPFERFAILKRDMLRDLAIHLGETFMLNKLNVSEEEFRVHDEIRAHIFGRKTIHK